jgi:hypothetical protein
LSHLADEKNETSEHRPRDRKLGDEWNGWSGDSDAPEREIDEKVSTFLSLAASVAIIFIMMFALGWYMIKPRIDQLHPLTSDITKWSGIGLSILLLLIALSECIALLKFKKSLLPYKLTEKTLLAVLPMTVWLGERFGISKDRVGSSFIKLNNILTKDFAARVDPKRPLILLPRCLNKEAKNQIMDRLNGESNKILTVGGGEQARKVIRQYNPSCILALACERDLMSGLKDVAEKIPVIAIPNKRPEGPCKNTHILLEELDDALQYINDRNVRTS